MNASTDVREIPLTAISDDDQNSPRLALSRGQIKTFAQIMREQGTGVFPPLVLMGPRDDGSYAIADGRHRVAAARQIQAASFPAQTFPWTTERELFALAVHLSSQNGVTLTQQEKRRAVMRLLREFPEYTMREIADVAGTSRDLVFRCRKLAEKGPLPERKRYRHKTTADLSEAILAGFDALLAAAASPADRPKLAAALAAAAGRRYAGAHSGRELQRQSGLLEAARVLLQVEREQARLATSKTGTKGVSVF